MTVVDCAIGALDGDPVLRVRRFVTDYPLDGPCTLIGGGQSAPDRAALLNGIWGTASLWGRVLTYKG